MPIIGVEVKIVTDGIHIQGGIDAVNGVYAVFNMETLMAVSETARLSKDRKQRESGGQEKKHSGLFAAILDEAVHSEEKAPAQFYTVVYGRNGQKSAMHYQTREYK